MELVKVLLFITSILLTIAGIVIGILALHKKDKVSKPALTHSGTGIIELKKWLKTKAAYTEIESILKASKTIQDLQNNLAKENIWYAVGTPPFYPTTAGGSGVCRFCVGICP